MLIKKIIIPQSYLISEYLPANYSDAFECTFSCKHKITPDDFMIAFWSYSPKWIEKLFTLRDWIVKLFGIKPGSKRSKEKLEEAIRTSGSYDFVNIVAKSTTETIISVNDKHLKMYFSVIAERNQDSQKLIVTTVVYFHNWLGRIYFYIIYPFHHLIVRSMLKHSINRLMQ